MSQEECCRTCERIFADHLDGHSLMTNAGHIRGSAWINFPRVLCRNWFDGKVILLGDAAHTAHFSIGSGSKLAFEDAIKLAAERQPDLMILDVSIPGGLLAVEKIADFGSVAIIVSIAD